MSKGFEMAKRGFFAELQYQNQLAAKRQLQGQREAARANAAAQRAAEQARREAERGRAQAVRASAAQHKVAEKEAKRLHEQSQLAEVASLNAQLAATYDEIDSMLAATLDVDDFVDLEQLRTVARHPPFARTDLETPVPAAPRILPPPEPVFVEPDAPKGLGGMFGKKKHAEAVAAASAAHAREHEAWGAVAATVPARQAQQLQEHQHAEERRRTSLEQARNEYRRECKRRDAETAATNRALDELIRGVNAGEQSAMQEYVGIVLSNSVYPDAFRVSHEFEFDAEVDELVIAVVVPPPQGVPLEKEYRFVKAKDEIVASALAKNALKGRYAHAVHQVALRTLHEVFEADRPGHLKTIALTVSTEAVDPATGQSKQITFVAVGADRTSFLTFNLANIVPSATLQHLGASVSKSPYDLHGIDNSPGVRGG